jgi:hypothetical protein
MFEAHGGKAESRITRGAAMPITVGVQGLEGVPDLAVLVGMLGLVACFVGLVSILWSVRHR